jgi:hypothetical protein
VKKFLAVVFITLIFLNPLYSYEPTEAEVKVALQALVIATTSLMASNNFDYPIFNKNLAYLKNDSSFSNLELFLKDADIGLLRLTVLKQPPLVEKPLGFFATLLNTISSFKPPHSQLITFLEANSGLLEDEIVISGFLKANRLYTNYFHYYAEGSVLVSGIRFEKPFTLELEFTIPLEGKEAFSLIPLKVKSGNKEYKEVASQLFQF